MKIYVTQFRELINQKVLKLSLLFALLITSVTLMNATTNLTCYTEVVVENETMKMSVIPDPEIENQAFVELYANSSSATIVIFNAIGMVVLEEKFDVEKDQKNRIKLDFTSFRAGTYYIVHDENKDSATYSVR